MMFARRPPTSVPLPATLFLAALFLAAAPQAAGAADLDILIKGVSGNQGNLRIALYSDPATFRKEAKALAVQSVPARPGDVGVTFPGLAERRYAAIAYHDENANGEMDRFLGMIPTEGYGLSNNPEVSGPPQFDPSAFSVSAGPATAIAIELRY